jgi:small-conductance mechanosensitive channel
VAYGTDLKQAFALLIDAAKGHPRILSEPAPGCILQHFGADGLEIQLGFWIADPENGTGNVRADLNLVILDRLIEAGIQMPFPQRELRWHPDSAAPPTAAVPAPPAAPQA